jgi:hypothetical protein
MFGPTPDGKPLPNGNTGIIGNQIATVGSVLMSQWAVRFTSTKIFLSSDAKACPRDQLLRDHFHRMDSTGYFQRSGPKADVKPKVKNLDVTIPTMKATLFGQTIPVQIDTGYQVSDAQIQVNDALFRLIEPQLGPVQGTFPINGQQRNRYVPAGASIRFIDSDTGQPFVEVKGIAIVPKPADDGGIALWGVPAAMISGRVFVKAFTEVELRADQETIWAIPAAQP